MKNSNIKMSISLIIVLLISMLAYTYAWYSSNNTPDMSGILTIGTNTEITLDSVNATDLLPYNGQKGYSSNNTLYEDDDNPYFAIFRTSLKALGSSDIKVKYTAGTCIIKVGSLFDWSSTTTINNIFGQSFSESNLEGINDYLGTKTSISTSDSNNIFYKFYNNIFNKNLETYDAFLPTNANSSSKGFVVLKDNSQQIESKVEYIVIKSQYVKEFFDISYNKVDFTNNEDGQLVAPVDGYITLYKNNDLSLSEVASTKDDLEFIKQSVTQFSIGYYGTVFDENGQPVLDETNTPIHSTFAFSDDTFVGSTFIFNIIASSEESK